MVDLIYPQGSAVRTIDDRPDPLGGPGGSFSYNSTHKLTNMVNKHHVKADYGTQTD